jgi:hypothetical protein
MRGRNEEFIDPRAFAAVFEAEVKADDEVGDGILVFADEIDETEVGIVEEFVKIFANNGFIESFGPGIVVLHMAHHLENGVEIVRSGKLDGWRHARRFYLRRRGSFRARFGRRGKIGTSGGDTVSTEAVASRRHAGGQPPVTGWKLELPTTTWHLLLN